MKKIRIVILFIVFMNTSLSSIVVFGKTQQLENLSPVHNIFPNIQKQENKNYDSNVEEVIVNKPEKKGFENYSSNIVQVKQEPEVNKVLINEKSYGFHIGTNWMSYLKDSTPLNKLSVPGTHDTMAYKGNWGPNFGFLNPVQRFTKTQDLTLSDQLNNGVRFLDIRIDVDMSIHHGKINLKSTLDRDVLPTIKKFLSDNRTEVVFARMAWENRSDPTKFEKNIAPIIDKYKDLFATVTKKSALKDARGKVVVFDNTGSSRSFAKRGLAYDYWHTSSLEKQDNYNNPSREEKKKAIAAQLVKASESTLKNEKMYINYISAAGRPPFGSTPRDFANDLNPFTKQYIEKMPDQNQLGMVIFDFITKQEIITLIQRNTKYRKMPAPTPMPGPKNGPGFYQLYWGEVPYTFDKSTGILTYTDGGTLGEFTSSPWNRTDRYKINAAEIKKINFTKHVNLPQNSKELFSNLVNLESINTNQLNTSNTTDMSFMFFNGKSLKTLDLSQLETSNVTNMSNLFNGVSSLKSLDLSKLDTSNVTDMSSMFSGMSSLTSLDLSTFDTSRAINTLLNGDTMYNMFSNTPELSQIKLGASFKFSGNGEKYIGLQNPPEGRTTGKWRNVGTGTVNDPKGNILWTSSQFVSNYTGVAADTYVWQKKGTDILVLYVDEQRNKLGREFISGIMGESYSTSERIFDGYTLKTVVGETKGIFTSENKKITYIYRKNSELNTDTNTKPNTDTNTKPSTDTNTKPNTNTNTKPSTDTNTKPNTDTNTKPSTDTNTKPNTDTNTKPNTDTNTKPSTDTNTKPSTDTNTKPNTDTNTKPSTDTNTKPNTNKTQVVYRVYNPNTGEHFYPTSTYERDANISAGWKNEGILENAPTSGTAVYRVYNPNAKGGDHYYTTSQYEAKSLVSKGWEWDNDAKPVFYSGGSKVVYVAYNPNADTGAHNYTMNSFEQNSLLSVGWKYGKTAWFAVK